MRRAVLTATVLTLLLGLVGCFGEKKSVAEERAEERAAVVDAVCAEFRWQRSSYYKENIARVRELTSAYDYTASDRELLELAHARCPRRVPGAKARDRHAEPKPAPAPSPEAADRDKPRGGGSGNYSDDPDDLTDGCWGEYEMYREMADEGMFSEADFAAAVAELEYLGCL